MIEGINNMSKFEYTDDMVAAMHDVAGAGVTEATIESLMSVSVKRFAKFRIISEVSEAEIFAKFRSVSTISVGSEIQIVSEIQVCDDSSKQSLKFIRFFPLNFR